MEDPTRKPALEVTWVDSFSVTCVPNFLWYLIGLRQGSGQHREVFRCHNYWLHAPVWTMNNSRQHKTARGKTRDVRVLIKSL